MKRIITIAIYLFIIAAISAQTQLGYVRTLGRPDKKGEALGGVTIRVKGGHNAVLSQGDGTFAMVMTGKRNGDAYSLQQVQKVGYELNERGVIGRQYAFSDRVPLTIVMVSTAQLQADKQRIENNAYRVAERNYKARLSQLEKKREEQTICAEQYRTELHDLQDKFEKYQSLIDELSEHYAHVDYDDLDEKEREINLCIENGDLERADSLIHTLFDPVDVLKRNKDALARIEQEIAQAQAIQEQANADMAAVLKQQEKDAEHLYQLYTIALANYDNEKARQYIETRAMLDTTNVEWLNKAGRFIEEYFADYSTALSYYQKVLRQSMLQFGEQSEWPAIALNNIGLVYSCQGDHPNALEYYTKALAIFENVLGSEHPNVAQSYNNIGSVYYDQGDYPKALEYYIKALDIYENVLGPEHPTIATSYDNIGNAYSSLGDYTKGLEFLIRALAIREKVHGPEHPDVATSYNNIGYIYYEQGNYLKALEYLTKALAIREEVLGSGHPDAGQSYNNIGNAYSSLGDYTKALDYYTKSLAISEKVFGSEHPDVATTYGSIGSVYYVQGKYPKALEYYSKALAILENVLGPEHPDTKFVKSMILDSKYNIALLDNTAADFLLEHIFIATIVDGEYPARQQGMSGEYILLEFADWTQDSSSSLFEKNKDLLGKPKDILVMKDGIISRHNFENTIGAQFGIKEVSREEREQINRAYEQWKKQNGR